MFSSLCPNVRLACLRCADTLGREHHALLGVDAVHFSARDPAFGSTIAEWNRRFGRTDSFTHIPPLDPAVAAVYGMMDQSVDVPSAR